MDPNILAWRKKKKIDNQGIRGFTPTISPGHRAKLPLHTENYKASVVRIWSIYSLHPQ
jgi:hypothetical protein